MKTVTRSVLVLLFYTAFAPVSVSAQPQWVNFTTNDLFVDLLFQGDSAWYAYRGGLALIERETQEVTVYNTANSELPDHAINGIALGPDGTLWLSTPQRWGTFSAEGYMPITDSYGDAERLRYLGNIQFDSTGQPYLMAQFVENGDNRQGIFHLSANGEVSLILSREEAGVTANLAGFILDQAERIWCPMAGGSLLRLEDGEITIFDHTNSPLLEGGSSLLTKSPDGDLVVLQSAQNVFSGVNELSIYRYTEDSWSTASIEELDEEGDDVLTIQQYFFDPAGNLWISGKNDYVLRYDGNVITKVPWLSFTETAQFSERFLANIDDDGNWWFYDDYPSTRRLYQYLDGQAHFYEVASADLRSNHIEKIYHDTNSTVWIGTFRGLSSYDGEAWVNHSDSMPKFYVKDIQRDADGSLWLAGTSTLSDPFSFLKYDGQEWEKFSLGNWGEEARDLFLDEQGVLWAATNGGLAQYDGQEWSLYDPTDPMLGDILYYIAPRADSGFYFANYEALYYFDGSTVEQLPPFPGGNFITKIYVDNADRLWILYSSGVARYENGGYTDLTSQFPEQATTGTIDMIQDEAGVYWFTTCAGLLRFGSNSWTVLDEGVTKTCLWNLEPDQYGNIWLATVQQGIAVYNEQGITQLGEELQACLNGRVMLDANQNGIADDADLPMAQQRVALLPDSQLTFTSQSGYYQFNVPNETLHSVALQPVEEYWSIVSDSTTYTRQVERDCVDSLDFALAPIGEERAGTISLSASAPQCGQNALLWLSLSNSGNTLLSGTLELKIDDVTSLVSASEAPAISIGDTYYWEVTDLPPGGAQSLQITIGYPSEALVDTIRFSAKAYDESGGVIDSSMQKSEFRCPHDPNHKTLRPTGPHLGPYIQQGEAIEFTIYFENQQLDTVNRVIIRDEIDPWLDLNTLELLSASHSVSVNLSGRQLTCIFDQIGLSNAQVDPASSQGFVQFRIRPKTDTPDGQRIENLAFIYFDYNAPAVTNTVEAFIVGQLPPTDTEEVRTQHACTFFFSPNPVSTSAVAQVPKAFLGGRFELYDIRGQLLTSRPIRSEVLAWERQGLPAGVYVYRVVKGGNACSGKLLLR